LSKVHKIGRGVSAGGGQSSLGYLFGSGETTSNAQIAQNQGSEANNNVPSQKTASAAASKPIDKQIPAGVPGRLTNNYFRADGQNYGNFVTE
jgi:SPIRAL1-like protein